MPKFLLTIHAFLKSFKLQVCQTTYHHQILHDPLSYPINISQISTVTYIHPNSYPFFLTPLYSHYGKTVLSSHNRSQAKITQLFTHCICIILDVWRERKLLWFLVPLYLPISLRPLPTSRHIRQLFPKLCWANLYRATLGINGNTII